MSRAASIAVLAVGIVVGLTVGRITERHDVDRRRLVQRLRDGERPQVDLVAVQRLRLFLGHDGRRHRCHGVLLSDVPRDLAALVSAPIASVVTSNPIYLAPVLLVLSLVGCLAGTYLSTPEEFDILKHFYRTTRPWGFWGPIRDEIMREEPAFEPNRDFWKDAINVLVGIVWQTCLTSLPIFIVFRSWDWAGGVLLILVVTSIFIKFNWYDKLPSGDGVAR